MNKREPMSISEKKNERRNGAQPQNSSAVNTGFGDGPNKKNGRLP